MNRFFTLAMLADNEMPTIGELIDELFSLNLGDYDNLGISGSTLTGLRGIIVALFIGVIIGAISSMFNRRVLGDFVRALTSGGCRTPESAKTLAELGFLKNTAVRASLRAGGVLGRSYPVSRRTRTTRLLSKNAVFMSFAPPRAAKRPRRSAWSPTNAIFRRRIFTSRRRNATARRCASGKKERTGRSL